MAEIECIDLRASGAWKRTTRWQRYIAKFNDKFKGDTERIVAYLKWRKGEWKSSKINSGN
jgi:hypothetical protein